MSRDPAPTVTLVVDDDQAGTRVDIVVGGLPGVESRAEGQRLIDAGRVTVNGQAVRRRHLVATGEVLEVRPQAAPTTDLAPQEVDFDVRYEDEDLFVIDKPAGVVTHPSRGHMEGTLVHGLLARGVAGGDDPTRPGIVHRLDRDTSGLLVVARTPRAHRRLTRMMRERLIERRYLSLVHGSMPPALTIDRPVGRDRRVRTRMSTSTMVGRDAVTHVRVVEALGHFDLIEARLDTGRTHQIRVHLEAVGHPVVGDPVYGRPGEDFGLTRQFLHAAELSFPHPETDEMIAISSPLPADLQGALDAARRRTKPAAQRARRVSR
jgi:23S rRNA pseudouridine1911/1915/1917 synthase